MPKNAPLISTYFKDYHLSNACNKLLQNLYFKMATILFIHGFVAWQFGLGPAGQFSGLTWDQPYGCKQKAHTHVWWVSLARSGFSTRPLEWSGCSGKALSQLLSHVLTSHWPKQTHGQVYSQSGCMTLVHGIGDHDWLGLLLWNSTTVAGDVLGIKKKRKSKYIWCLQLSEILCFDCPEGQ